MPRAKPLSKRENPSGRRPSHRRTRETISESELRLLFDAKQLRHMEKVCPLPTPLRGKGEPVWRFADIADWFNAYRREAPWFLTAVDPSVSGVLKVPQAAKYMTPKGLIAVDSIVENFGLTK